MEEVRRSFCERRVVSRTRRRGSGRDGGRVSRHAGRLAAGLSFQARDVTEDALLREDVRPTKPKAPPPTRDADADADDEGLSHVRDAFLFIRASAYVVRYEPEI